VLELGSVLTLTLTQPQLTRGGTGLPTLKAFCS